MFWLKNVSTEGFKALKNFLIHCPISVSLHNYIPLFVSTQITQGSQGIRQWTIITYPMKSNKITPLADLNIG